MGNIVQCCRILSSYFRCQETLTQNEPERSALLSSEDSEGKPSSLSDNSEEDLPTVSMGVTNPTLEPENFLFPDIILSSSLGGGVALAEPMVCLLVSEEGEATRVDEGGGGSRVFSEVETQTEVKTWMGSQAQTQTETPDRAGGGGDKVASEDVTQVNVSVDAQRDGETPRGEADVAVCSGGVNRIDPQRNEAAFKGYLIHEVHTLSATSTNRISQTERARELHASGEERHTWPLHIKGCSDESQHPSVRLTEHGKNFDSFRCVDGTRQSQQGGKQAGQESDQQNKGAEPHTGDQFALLTNFTQHQESCQSAHGQETPHPWLEVQKEGEVLSSADSLVPAGKGDCAEEEDVASPSQLTEADENIPVDLQDTSFTITIEVPGTESFELQVSGQLLVAELQRILMEHELTCHRTCFSLQLGGNTLDGLAKLRDVKGLQDGASVKVVEESYSIRDARLHLKHVCNLLRSLDPADAYNGVNFSSLSYLSYYTKRATDPDSLRGRTASDKESTDLRPPDYLLPGCKNLPLTPLQPIREDRKLLQCLRVLTVSSWNPPPGNRKMHGDLMYLNLLTLEDKEVNITASTRGFYLNQSTAFNFNPKPAHPRILCHSLIELLSQVSPTFRKSFSALQKRRALQHPYERIATPFQVFTWIARQEEHTLECVRAEEMHPSHMGPEEHAAGQVRDWNEELQGCRELAQNSIQERLHRERSIFKTNSDFVEAATRGAIAVADGNVMALNPGEAPHMHMFIWSNLFLSLGFDHAEHYLPLGGDSAAHAAAVCDLRGTQAYTDVNPEGLHTLGLAVVDYRGIRVVVQTIVPGILEKQQEQSIIYGSNDHGKTVCSHPGFLELLNKTSKLLRIQQHRVLNQDNSPVELCSSVETKGIMGNDGRPYILDLLHTFPPDLNFQFPEVKKDAETPEECRRSGFPRGHRHSLARLRPELIEAFTQHRHELYDKMVSWGLNQIEEPEIEQQEDPAQHAAEERENRRRNVIGNACSTAGSVSQTHFDLRFNPDVCSPGVRFPSDCATDWQKQRRLLWDAAAFLLSNQIPAVLRDCLEDAEVPMDGVTMTSALHRRGVNVRYLDAVLKKLERDESKARLTHIQRICVGEIIVRSAKHIFRNYLQNVEPTALSAAVSHFLNCLLGSTCLPDTGSAEPPSRRRSRRRRTQPSRVALSKDSGWTRLSPSELWSRIRAEAHDYYHHTIDGQSLDEVLDRHGLQRISLLREIAVKTGIQVKLREYVFESRHQPAFSEEDIVNMFPRVKHLRVTGTDASRLMQHAEVLMQQGRLRDSYELITQAHAQFSTVCGVLHEDVCRSLRLLGRLSYIRGDNSEALSYQEKAVMSSERVHGIDHPQTIRDYTHLALYCAATGKLLTSLRLLYRARYLTLLVTGEGHPQVMQVDMMLGLVLFGLMELELSLKFLQNALMVAAKHHGSTSLKCAHCHYLLATVYESKEELQMALHHENEAHSIYCKQAGESGDGAKKSSKQLQGLSQQTVVLQETISQSHSLTPDARASLLKFSSSNLPAILHQLNRACGIIIRNYRP